MSVRYQSVGTIDRAAASSIRVGDQQILVDTGDDELHIAEPAGGEDDE
ncbi:hypothetical protein [Natrarchaeobaculum sulfurireducens]|nr:hypothetical protein [Natrarchaeobaculum sulfurireducens]